MLLDCRDIHMDFSGLRALGGVDFSAAEGEIVALVGPNGSGKSTLVNVMSGAMRPTSGRIRFGGVDITGRKPHAISRLGIARTYQIPRPFGTMTVLGNVAFAASFSADALPQREAEQRAWECLDFTKLAGVAHQLPSAINLQQRKFLELARALAARPRLLMLDEVLTGLNPAEIEDSLDLIRRIHDSGVTLIIVEHLMRVITQLASRLVVLDRGKLLAQGDPGDVMGREDVITAYLGREYA
jgi:branched-chain amino acid transport system permease protein